MRPKGQICLRGQDGTSPCGDSDCHPSNCPLPKKFTYLSPIACKGNLEVVKWRPRFNEGHCSRQTASLLPCEDRLTTALCHPYPVHDCHHLGLLCHHLPISLHLHLCLHHHPCAHLPPDHHHVPYCSRHYHPQQLGDP